MSPTFFYFPAAIVAGFFPFYYEIAAAQDPIVDGWEFNIF